MKIKLFIYVMTIFIVSCSFSLDFGSKTSTDRKLYKTHSYSEKADDLIFFYNIKHYDDKQLVSITLKNKSHFYMSNFAIKVFYDNNINSDFFRLGSIKNGGMKSFDVKVSPDIKKIHLEFEYQLTRQDSFMKTEAYGGQSEHQFGNEDTEVKKDSVVLYLKR